MAENSLVSIIMSVYNEEQYIMECIESILAQTYLNFEFLVFDDASTDGTAALLSGVKDERIKVITNRTNMGLTRNLNKAMKIAQGTYIMRMDADDVAMPDRIKRQLQFLKEHPGVALISCGYKQIGIKSDVYQGQPQWSSERIRAMLMYHSVLPHPGFFFNKQMIQEHKILYNTKLRYAQDYHFQVQVSRYYDVAFLEDILLKYRVSLKQISVSKWKEQQECANYTRIEQLKAAGIKTLPIPIEVWESFCMNRVLKEHKLISLLHLSVLVLRIIRKSRKSKSPLYPEIKTVSIEKLKTFWRSNLLL